MYYVNETRVGVNQTLVFQIVPLFSMLFVRLATWAVNIWNNLLSSNHWIALKDMGNEHQDMNLKVSCMIINIGDKIGDNNELRLYFNSIRAGLTGQLLAATIQPNKPEIESKKTELLDTEEEPFSLWPSPRSLETLINGSKAADYFALKVSGQPDVRVVKRWSFKVNCRVAWLGSAEEGKELAGSVVSKQLYEVSNSVSMETKPLAKISTNNLFLYFQIAMVRDQMEIALGLLKKCSINGD